MLALLNILKTTIIPAGAIVELGAGNGDSALEVINFFSAGEEKVREFWFFDSFCGFPEPSTIDMESKRAPKKGEWSCDRKAFEEKIERHKNIHIVEGYVEDTIPNQYHGGEIALLHIDLDLYSGYKHSLENLYCKVTSGGFIFMDEYDERYDDGSLTLKWPGAKKAIDEFIQKYELQDMFFKYSRGKAYIRKL